MLLAAYQPAQPTYRTLFLRRDFRDFKPHRHLRIGDFPNLVQLSENGEIQAGTMSESQELVSLATFARRIRVTRQMLVNDDLGAFTTGPVSGVDGVEVSVIFDFGVGAIDWRGAWFNAGT